MPRVTVVSVPEDVLQTPAMPAPKPRFKKIPWRAVIGRIAHGLGALVCGHLPLNILAFLLGRVAIMGEMSPFGLALFAAVAHADRGLAPTIALWSLVGVISSGHYQEAGVYVLSIFLFFRMSDKLTRLQRKMLVVPLFIACAAASAGVLINTFTEVSLYSIVMAVFDGAICLVSTYIFLYSMPVFIKGYRKVQQVSSDSLICMVVMLAIAVAGFGNIMIADYSLRNIAGGMLIMVLALSGGAGLGASVGVAVGLVIGLTENNVPAAISLYALAGLLAGVFKRLGRFAVILGFILGSMMTLLYFGQSLNLMLVLTEIALSASLFLILPSSGLAVWQQNLCESDSSEVPLSSAALNEAKAKINNIAEMFGNLADAFSTITVTDKDKGRDDEVNRALAVIGERVCGPCTKRTGCWQDNFYRTYQIMLDILARGKGEKLKVAHLSQSFKEICIKPDELIDTVNLIDERNQSLSFWHKKLTDHRQMVTEQMRAAGTIIGSLAHEIAKEPRSDRELAYELKSKAALIDCPMEQVRITGAKGAAKVEAYKNPCKGTRECKNSILPLAASLMQEKLMLRAECGKKGSKCKLTMQVASRLSVITGVASAAKDPHGICGDTCAVVPLNKGKFALMLSDGMGSGSKAAGESNMAVGFLEKLLAVGFDVDVAVKTVNSLLLLKTPEESFATVDMAIIDTYSGDTEFLKIGSAPSYIKRVREVSTIQSSSLPIGIIHQIEINPIKTAVVAGDIIIMVSDGIADVVTNASRRGGERESWIPNFLRKVEGDHPQEIADHLLRQAVHFSGSHLRDDMTVLVAKIVQQSINH
ncbi:Stage II sporulation protein E [bioreactor metagenome]|uniref:Stage II sporulation protein E n=1 Tax=bioreactor metagenome TaxID=1076179 RepID=A0A644UDV4_9ZZZZ|nr:stage II sporulation protein E [Negativicutes bacterium]